jgi:hypothetical protein
MTEEQWIKVYRPETDEHGDLYVQRDWTNAADLALIEAALQQNRLWTMVEGDGGNPVIMQGFRRVNRLYYIITEVPYDPDALEVVVDCEVVYCVECGHFFNDLSRDEAAVERGDDGMTCVLGFPGLR